MLFKCFLEIFLEFLHIDIFAEIENRFCADARFEKVEYFIEYLWNSISSTTAPSLDAFDFFLRGRKHFFERRFSLFVLRRILLWICIPTPYL